MIRDDRTFGCRAASAQDDEALRELMRAQMSIDPGWPPDYAKSSDLAEWLRKPSTLGRWVAVDTDGVVAGHVGLGAVESGPAADLWCESLGCRSDALAEICRMVVHPSARMHGLGGLLTRKAMRTAIEAGRVPVATVLNSRVSWLRMMLDTGWRSAGTVVSRMAGAEIGVLIPPQRFVALALGSSGE